MAVCCRFAEVLRQALDLGEAGRIAAQLPALETLATELGGCRCRSGDGPGAGAADAAQTKGLGDLGDGQRIDDAAGDAAFHDQVAFPGECRLARIVHLLLLVVVPNAGAGMIARLCCRFASNGRQDSVALAGRYSRGENARPPASRTADDHERAGVLWRCTASAGIGRRLYIRYLAPVILHRRHLTLTISCLSSLRAHAAHLGLSPSIVARCITRRCGR